ncbi:hypothetical protein JXI42_03005 [bacterium]|nr:hypothetical protein [bacterium]
MVSNIKSSNPFHLRTSLLVILVLLLIPIYVSTSPLTGTRDRVSGNTLSALSDTGYPAGYFYIEQNGVSHCVKPIIVTEEIESLWFSYYSSSMHTGMEEPYKSKVFFFYNRYTGSMGALFVHNIDATGTSNATCDMYFIDLPESSEVAVSDDPSHVHTGSTGRACGSPVELDIDCWPQGGWYWTSNTDGGAFYLPRAEWKFTIDHYWGGTDPITSWWFVSGGEDTTEIPLSMEVGDTLLLGHGFLQLLPFPDDSIWLDCIRTGTDTTISIIFQNCDETIDTLDVTGATHSNPNFFTTTASGLTPPGAYGVIEIIFVPAAPGIYVDTVMPVTNEPCGTTPIFIYANVYSHSIETVRLSEETLCDESNVVEICYTLEGDDAEIAAMISSNGGATWHYSGDDYFHTFQESEGNIGSNVLEGTHCFRWLMSEDMPGVESSSFKARVFDPNFEHCGVYGESALECLDSKAPEIAVECLDTMTKDDTLFWSVDDLFLVTDTCFLHFYGCGIDEEYVLTDNNLNWAPPRRCESCTLTISARDSFCNWQTEICEFLALTPDTLKLSLPYSMVYPGDTILIPLHYRVNQLLNTSGFECTISYDPGIITPLEFIIAGTPMDTWTYVDFDNSIDGLIAITGQGEYLDTDSILCYIKAEIPSTAPEGGFSNLAFSSAELNEEWVPVQTDDGFLIVMFVATEWLFDLVFNGDGFELNTTLTIGMSYYGSEGYEEGLDIISLPVTNSTNAWFPLDDPTTPHITKLSRDIRDIAEIPECWIIETSLSPGVVTWNPDFLPPGEFLLNNIIDLRTADHYFYEADEAIEICFNRPVPQEITYHLNEGWNMVSFPILPVCENLNNVFPTMLDDAYWYDPEGNSYTPTVLPERGKSFWIYSSVETAQRVAGIPVLGYSLNVYPGWNMIGSIMDTTSFSEIAFDPPASFIPPQYGYSPGGYVPVTEIIPTKGYWGLCDDRSTINVGF